MNNLVFIAGTNQKSSKVARLIDEITKGVLSKYTALIYRFD